MSSVVIAGNTSGSITISAPDVSGSNTLTLPVATDTLVGKATTDTLTNKTLVNPTITGLQTLNTPNTFGFKNRIINGGMVIDQRNAGGSLSATTSTFGVDRWQAYAGVNSKYTTQQNAGSVTPPAGFTKYLGVTSSSAYSPATGDVFTLLQNIEGFNTADLAWGTASASTVTLSFWVRSSLTGTFGGSLANDGFHRAYPFSYTISTANTWEQKSVTISGDTTGTWTTDNSAGIRLYIDLGSGSIYQGTAGSWGVMKTTVTGATSVVGTSGATFYITGVQLEKGSTATSFDYRDYGRELIMCQRYYQRADSTGTVNMHAGLYSGVTYIGQTYFKTSFRAAPTVTGISGNNYSIGLSDTNSFYIVGTGGATYVTQWNASAEL